jgi:hypothetical protein
MKYIEFAVMVIAQSASGDAQYDEVGRFSTEAKAQRCLNLCEAVDGQLLYLADENGNEMPVDMEALRKTSDFTFKIWAVESQRPLDTFALEGEEYDWRE